MTAPDTTKAPEASLGSLRPSDCVPIELGPKRCGHPAINLRDFGFVGTVSEEAREKIRALDRRAMLVLTTSERFWFR